MHRAPTQRVSLCRCAREVRRVRALRYARALARPRSKPPLRTYAPTSPTPCTLPPARGVRPSCKAARAAWRVFEQPISTPPRDRSRPQHAPHRPPQARGRCAGAAAGGGGRESAGDGAATARGRRQQRRERPLPRSGGGDYTRGRQAAAAAAGGANAHAPLCPAGTLQNPLPAQAACAPAACGRGWAWRGARVGSGAARQSTSQTSKRDTRKERRKDELHDELSSCSISPRAP